MELPALRQELSLSVGPVLADGQPSYTLEDPSRNLFFQLDWTTFEILRRWTLGEIGLIVESVNAETTLHIDEQAVLGVAKFLEDKQLLWFGPGNARKADERIRKNKPGWGKWLLHNYLFLRVPLLKPDRWLSAWVGKLEWIYTPAFWWLTLGALLLGLIQVYRDWDRFSSTLADSFTFAGLLSYGVTLVIVKTMHELGHAFTAKRLGCKVPTMGVALLVLLPVAYTDTNDVWKLTTKKHRLQVAAAGILTELTIAAWATLLWTLLPEGPLKTMAFWMATTTWISTVIINASPFMRFDGYFLISDWLEMPNLHPRAFAMARWNLREFLFALGDPVPEVFPRRRHVGLILFAYVTWIYRVVLFMGIAALVYAFFIKAVGIFLFIVEIVWFMLLPPYEEFKVWRARWSEIRASRRAQRSGLVAALVLLLFVLPWPSRLSSSAMLRPAEPFVIYAPPRAQLVSLPIKEGQAVKAGTVLMEMGSLELESRRQAALARQERSHWLATAGAFDAEQRAQWQVSLELSATAEAELANINADAARYSPVAPFDGVFREIDPDLKPGEWLTAREPLGRLIPSTGHQVVAYFDEENVRLIEKGQSARFYADGIEGPFLRLEVVQINTDVSRILPEMELSHVYGGSLLVREKRGQYYPEQAVYRVTFRALDPLQSLSDHSWRGKVVVSANWASPGARFVRAVVNVFWREAGF
ncbi:MAG: hypothetical protein RLZZ271_732 [Pseudomonadota bacterium]|jgi:putative peptide zinc metalloprotease protein